MQNILVTGAGGYIGTTLVPMLLDQGFKVRAIDRFFFGNQIGHHPNLELIKEDTRHIKESHFNKIDAVIDLVAISNDPSGETFQDATWQINHLSRVRTAEMARSAGVTRYILPSSCSIYGFLDPGISAAETTPTNPLTTYSRANEKAEQETLPLATDDFTVIVLRQATVYGYSPRMRFDLAINGMTYGAWNTGRLPTMRDGTQWRPMIHVRDAAAAQIFMLTADAGRTNGQIFNVGSDANNYQLGDLAKTVASNVPKDVEIDWYGDPDHRSYRVNFQKIEDLGYKARYTAEDGVHELCEVLATGKISKTTETLTLDWYKSLQHWHEIIKNVELYGGILDI